MRTISLLSLLPLYSLILSLDQFVRYLTGRLSTFVCKAALHHSDGLVLSLESSVYKDTSLLYRHKFYTRSDPSINRVA